MSLIQFVCDNDLEGVKRLIQNGVDVNGVVDAFGCTALWYAAYEGRVKCAATILDAKADVDKASVNGYTPLHRASCNGHAECVRLLLLHKANMNTLNIYGFSPLHYASMNGYLSHVQIMVAAGTLCEKDRPNNDGCTPLAFAIRHNHPNVAEFLFHSGAKMSNVKPSVKVPAWMNQLVSKRKNAILSTFTLKGILRKRVKIPGAEAAFLKGRPPKDIVDLIGLHVWSTRLDPKWGGSSEDDLKKMKK